jgi:truncated hemoglobin YjbI
MKKSNKTNTVLLILLALVVGFFAGTMVDFPALDKEDLSGTIGKVSKYRNVKMTQEDVQLRNELLTDTLRLAQYEKYLMYHYYHSLKTSDDVEKVLERTTSEESFHQTYYPYADALKNLSAYLEKSRLDILNAVQALSALNAEEDAPVISLLNDAQNAIARIRNHNTILMDYMGAIERYLSENPNGEYPLLAEAHDIIMMNRMQAAILTQDKPSLQYLNKKKYASGTEELASLNAPEKLRQSLQDHTRQDMEKLGLFNSANSELQSVALQDLESLEGIWYWDAEQLGGIIFLDQSQLQSLMLDQENLGLLFDADRLSLVF